jgi:sulfide dehydrogenase cytochrome subunit
MMNKAKLLTILLLLSLMSVAQQDVVSEDLEQEIDLQALIKQCEGCHGPRGNSTREDVPTLAGKPVAAIEESITQFYYYERHCPTKTPVHDGNEGNPSDMCTVANSLSKAEIQALAEYFSTQ